MRKAGITVVPGGNDGRNRYANTARVEVTDTIIFDEDSSHYCNEAAVDADGVADSEDNCLIVAYGPPGPTGPEP